MSELLKKWYRENVDRDGHYAVFTGFESAISEHRFHAVYDELDVDDQIALYDFVTDMIGMEASMSHRQVKI